MIENKVTPGPWRAVDLRHQQNGQIRIRTDAPGEYGWIANVLRAGPRPEADARLIAAAPCLLTVAETVSAEWRLANDCLKAGESGRDELFRILCRWQDNACAAIERAKGADPCTGEDPCFEAECSKCHGGPGGT